MPKYQWIITQKTVIRATIFLFSSIESIEKGGKQYIYVHYRLDGVLTTKYAEEYSDVLYNLIRNNIELAKNRDMLTPLIEMRPRCWTD